MRGTIRWRRWTAITLSVCCCFLGVACAETSTPAGHRGGGPPPPPFVWGYSPSRGATTPQAAYARSAHFAPCRQPNGMTTNADQSVTWLLSGPSMGVVYLRATCRDTRLGNYLYRNFLVFVKDKQRAWYPELGGSFGFERRLPFPPPVVPTPVDPTQTPEPRAPSLADLFPADTYLALPPWRASELIASEPMSMAGRAWVALTPGDYILGLLQDSITRPQEALATTVGGLQGWVTEANGMATIVAPRPDGAIFFFAGTGSASEVEALAARALPRAEEALGGPLPPAITPTPAAITPSPGT